MAAVVPVTEAPTPLTAGISPHLAAALERGRSSYNGRWRARRPRGEAQEFLAVLAANLDPGVSVVAHRAPDRTDAVCSALFDTALELWARGSLHADAATDAAAALFQRAFPALAPLLAKQPAAVASSLGNALLELHREGIVDPAVWVGELTSVAHVIDDLETLRRVGVVLAWHRGLAHARDAALAALAALDARVVAPLGVICGVRSLSADDVRARLSPRWGAWPAFNTGPRRIDLVGFAGEFEAFGGPFRRPPTVRAVKGRLLAGHGDAWWTIHADDFGVVLRPAAADAGHVAADPCDASVGIDGTARWRGLLSHSFLFDRATSWAATDDTMAIACRDSHRVRLLAMRGGAA